VIFSCSPRKLKRFWKLFVTVNRQIEKGIYHLSNIAVLSLQGCKLADSVHRSDLIPVLSMGRILPSQSPYRALVSSIPKEENPPGVWVFPGVFPVMRPKI